MIRAINISIALNGTNRFELVQDFEKNRLEKPEPCVYSDKLAGHLPLQSRLQNVSDYNSAKELCDVRMDCYAISMINQTYIIHNETVILHSRQYSVSGAGDTVRTNTKVSISNGYISTRISPGSAGGNCEKMTRTYAPVCVWPGNCHPHSFRTRILVVPHRPVQVPTVRH